MKKLSKITAAVIGASMLLAAPASAQITSLDQLLGQVRADASRTAAENTQRVNNFRSRANEQGALLDEARSELAQLERRAASVERLFAGNTARIDELKGELNAAQGEFSEVFGLARARAGEFKSVLDNSLISADIKNEDGGSRTEVLEKVANSDSFASTEELNKIWGLMLEEIQAQREVSTFEAPIANLNDGAVQKVTRVGPFTAFTQDGQFLSYSAPTDENPDLALALLPTQPGGAINAAANGVLSGGSGELVMAPIDPTRGALLAAQDLVPDVKERVAQGGPIGYIIIGLAAFGSLFGLLRILFLMLTSSKVRAQKRKAQASKGNPLGRVMMAYEDSKMKDEETVELKLDEAILRESPKLEFGLNFLKLGAGIAPLLGLLGTVTGMIKTFQAMMIYGAGDPQLMAGGISEALVTTMLGLIAAIPLLILHSFCASLARGVQGTLEEQSAGIVARHVESRR